MTVGDGYPATRRLLAAAGFTVMVLVAETGEESRNSVGASALLANRTSSTKPAYLALGLPASVHDIESGKFGLASIAV